VKARRARQCQWCAHQVYPTAGTPFDRTRTSLRDWFYVMFLFTTTRNGVAAKRVQRELGVTYKTAWRMCHEIRKYTGQIDGDEPIGGAGSVVEVDETIFGGVLRGTGRGRYMAKRRRSLAWWRAAATLRRSFPTTAAVSGPACRRECATRVRSPHGLPALL
jgi:hypothetical protein